MVLEDKVGSGLSIRLSWSKNYLIWIWILGYNIFQYKTYTYYNYNVYLCSLDKGLLT